MTAFSESQIRPILHNLILGTSRRISFLIHWIRFSIWIMSIILTTYRPYLLINGTPKWGFSGGGGFQMCIPHTLEESFTQHKGFCYIFNIIYQILFIILLLIILKSLSIHTCNCHLYPWFIKFLRRDGKISTLAKMDWCYGCHVTAGSYLNQVDTEYHCERCLEHFIFTAVFGGMMQYQQTEHQCVTQEQTFSVPFSISFPPKQKITTRGWVCSHSHPYMWHYLITSLQTFLWCDDKRPTLNWSHWFYVVMPIFWR